MKISKIIALTFLAGAALLTSCKKADVQPSGMTLDQTSVSLFVGQTATVTPVFTPSGSSASVSWKSSDETVATVNGGYIEAFKAGTATISATGNQFNGVASCEVIVSNVPATSVIINKATLLLYENESGEQLTAKVEPYNVTFPEITWASSDATVAIVDANGNVSPVAKGEADITAKLADGTQGVCKVTVKVRVPTEPEVLEFWKSDKASYRGLFGAAVDNGKSAGEGGWLHYQDGVASWDANETGKPRHATLELSTGSEITINQVSPKDIAGDYEFYSYSFKAIGYNVSNTVDLGGDRNHKTELRIVAVDSPEVINGHEYNMDIIGLYCDFKVRSSFELTDEGPVFRVYLVKEFFDVDHGGAVESIAVIPELTNSATYSTGYFAPATFGPDDCNYTWPAWDVKDIFTEPKITLGSGDARKVTSDRWFCGFSFCKEGYTAYTTIYQLNHKNIWVWAPDNGGGAYFKKK